MFRAFRTASLSTTVLATLATLTAACADAPTSPSGARTPSAAPSAGKSATTTTSTSTTTTSTTTAATAVNGLLWTKAVTQTTVSAVIGSAGGSLSIPNGIKLTVPKGAVSSNVTFSITRLPGNVVAYDFQPHGTKFAVPLQLAQPTLGTNLFQLDPAKSIDGGYVADLNTIDQTAGTAVVNEFRPTLVAADKAWVNFTVDHFSGYIVSWGRH